MLNIGMGLLCLVFGPAIMIEGQRILVAKIRERKAVARLYALTTEETTRRRVHASRRLTA